MSANMHELCKISVIVRSAEAHTMKARKLPIHNGFPLDFPTYAYLHKDNHKNSFHCVERAQPLN